jgi:hypothetical protein
VGKLFVFVVGCVVGGMAGATVGFLVGCILAASTKIDREAGLYAEGFADGKSRR